MRIFGRQSHDVPLVVFGASSAEGFDYLFGDQPGYLPYWASGWSARSLGRPHVQEYVLNLLAGVNPRAQILLNFGMQDLIFGLPASLRAAGFRGCLAGDDTEVVRQAEVVVASAILGQVALMRRLNAVGFCNMIAVFWALPPDLPPDYWLSRDLPALPARFLGQLYRSIAPRMQRHRVRVADLTRYFGGDILAPKFARQALDHHPDYIRCQRVLWRALQGLAPVLPKRRYWRCRAWPHERIMIGDLIAAGRPRPRTCR